ncbi:unnamed protein product [Miscanthus lutarioriparius]|uniref:DOG1 domain-containing protein n=1 Tax=Miscanthus lutarioriparius TaxID=422564 RepID=A0A811NXE9_9POAL|nr:unnamed protein product [Miscanthus lutarioriparius]
MDMARYESCYRHWIAGQEAGLAELEAASANAAAGRATDAELRAVVERCILGYQDYATRRRALSREDGAAFFAPPWCTAFENSVLWLGGCRPSLTVRLLYNLSGEGLEAQVEELLGGLRHGVVPTGALGITSAQLLLINDLHIRTVHQENALSDRLATLQEDVADRPLLPIVRQRGELAAAAARQGARAARGTCDGAVRRLGAAGPGGGADAEAVDAALDSYEAALSRLLVEADELRMATARALATEILTPRQAVEMLAASKHLHLSVRDWTRRREAAAGAQQQLNGPSAGTAGSTSATVRRNP